MFFLNKLSLRRLNGRIFWSFIGLASLMLLTGVGANLLLGEADRSNQEQLLRLRQVSNIKTLRAAIGEQRNGTDLIILYKITNVLEFIALNNIRTNVTIREMKRDFPDGEVASTQFADISNLYEAVSSRISSKLGQPISPAEEQALYADTKKALEQIEEKTAKFLENRQQAADISRENYIEVLQNTRGAYVIISIILFALAALFALLIARLISRPLSILVRRLRRIAVGDLTEQMALKGADEIVELSLIFNRTVANLKFAIASIQNQTEAISLTSQQISHSSDSQANSLAQHATAVSQVSSTIVRLSDTSQNIADSAIYVASSANIALESATEGYNAMGMVNEAMNEIREKVNLIADRILNLNALSQRIRETTLLIDLIANETHLLALNAAIESAGAGEEGARFGAIAAQVRKLAQRSRRAAVEIQDLVTQIQQSSASSVMATEEGIKVVARGEEMVSGSLGANQNIIEQVGQTTRLAQAISEATQQQRTASTEAADTMRQLSQISQNISYDSQQYLTSATNLGEVVTQLNTIVNAFVLQNDETNQPDKPLTEMDNNLDIIATQAKKRPVKHPQPQLKTGLKAE